MKVHMSLAQSPRSSDVISVREAVLHNAVFLHSCRFLYYPPLDTNETALHCQEGRFFSLLHEKRGLLGSLSGDTEGGQHWRKTVVQRRRCGRASSMDRACRPRGTHPGSLRGPSGAPVLFASFFGIARPFLFLLVSARSELARCAPRLHPSKQPSPLLAVFRWHRGNVTQPTVCHSPCSAASGPHTGRTGRWVGKHWRGPTRQHPMETTPGCAGWSGRRMVRSPPQSPLTTVARRSCSSDDQARPLTKSTVSVATPSGPPETYAG